ncbi:MAG TPA: NAD(P)/FAD-dependent oxidoreductase [Chthoniobacterales bacterium]
MQSYEYDAVVVGAGPNGLAAAIRIAQHGFSTLVLEGSDKVGGACRTEELTLNGFQHDVGSAVHPLALASPFFSSLPLEKYGLTWVQPGLPLAHPISDRAVAVLERSVQETSDALGKDAPTYNRIFGPIVSCSKSLIEEFLQPMIHVPRHPLTAIRFGISAVLSAQQFVRSHSFGETAAALFAGNAAHSFLPLSSPGSAAFGLMLGMLGHSVGWPIPSGGAQTISDALLGHLKNLGGKIQTGVFITSLNQLPRTRVILLDTTPRQLLRLAGQQLPVRYRRRLEHFRYGPGIFKIDYALDGPIPWIHEVCQRAGTIHMGGTFDEIAHAEAEVSQGKCPERPFLLLSQPTLFDPTRAPSGKHILWAYCHVPNGSSFDMTERIEKQIDRFAPGFSNRILFRRATPAIELESKNANLIGGAITGGANDLWQMLARPTLSTVPYRTPIKGVFLCSSSTPPGGGVHGMCGFHAANAALRFLQRRP